MRLNRFGDSHPLIVTFSQAPHLWWVMVRHTARTGLLLLLATTVSAQQPITMEDAVAAALARNPALAAARAQVDRAAADLAAATGAWFPRVTLTESVQRGTQPVFAFGAMDACVSAVCRACPR